MVWKFCEIWKILSLCILASRWAKVCEILSHSVRYGMYDFLMHESSPCREPTYSGNGHVYKVMLVLYICNKDYKEITHAVVKFCSIYTILYKDDDFFSQKNVCETLMTDTYGDQRNRRPTSNYQNPQKLGKGHHLSYHQIYQKLRKKTVFIMVCSRVLQWNKSNVKIHLTAWMSKVRSLATVEKDKRDPCQDWGVVRQALLVQLQV